GQIQHAHEVTVVDQWKADERARGEILVAQQRMSLRLTDVADEQRLARCRDLPGDAFADRDTRAFGDTGCDAPRRRDVERLAVGKRRSRSVRRSSYSPCTR